MASLKDDTSTERIAALHDLVQRLDRSPRSSRLDEAIRRWSTAVASPAEVVAYASAVRGRLDGCTRRGEILDRLAFVAVTAVSERQVSAALTDPLTGLATRARMAEELPHLLAASQRAGSPLTAVMLDVDGLKRINDEHGHAAGDVALAEVGRAVRAQLRAADRAYRWGGDEFLMFLPATSLAEARLVVSRIQASCSTVFSAGTALHTDGTREVDVATWLSEADSDLYRQRAAARALPVAAPRRRGARTRLGWMRQAVLLGLLATIAGALGWTGATMSSSQPTAPVVAAPQAPELPVQRPAVRAPKPAAVPAQAAVRTVRRVAVRHAPAARPARPAPAPTAAPVVPTLPTAPPAPAGIVATVVVVVGEVLHAVL